MSTLFTSIHNVCVSLTVKDHISYPGKTRGKNYFMVCTCQSLNRKGRLDQRGKILPSFTFVNLKLISQNLKKNSIFYFYIDIGFIYDGVTIHRVATWI